MTLEDALFAVGELYVKLRLMETDNGRLKDVCAEQAEMIGQLRQEIRTLDPVSERAEQS